MKKSFALLLFLVFALLCYISVSNPVGAYEEVDYDAVSSAKLPDYLHRSSGIHSVLTSGKIGGRVLPSYSDCASGTVVNIIIKPMPGYEPLSICVISSNGDLLEVLYEDGQYSFVMPDSTVFIDVNFQLMRS
jgi:hypothetical protein